jgi:hypothetical protein
LEDHLNAPKTSRSEMSDFSFTRRRNIGFLR